MNRYFISMAFHGGAYHGWQVQQNAHTVQAVLEEKLSLILGMKTNVTGCGRTDTGVHARQFYAHFQVAEPLSGEKGLVYKLNGFLPDDIVVYDIFPVDRDMHARFSAVSRTYRYYISRQKDPFHKDQRYFYFSALHVEAMQGACQHLIGQKDFTSFSKLHTQTATNICTVTSAAWEQEGYLLVFTIAADRFLRNMVRAVVGTLLEIGKEKITVVDMKKIIEEKDRTRAGFSVPAQGLFLEKVEYPEPDL